MDTLMVGPKIEKFQKIENFPIFAHLKGGRVTYKYFKNTIKVIS